MTKSLKVVAYEYKEKLFYLGRGESKINPIHAFVRESDALAVIAELEAEAKHWKSNHDNVVAKLRILTQREDLPADRLPAYQRIIDLEEENARLIKDKERLEAAERDAERLVWATNHLNEEHRVLFFHHVLRSGGIDDLGDCRTYIDYMLARLK